MQKILIIEDDEKIRDELESFLNKHGYNAKALIGISENPMLCVGFKKA